MEPMTIREILEAVDGKLLGEFSDLDLTVKHVFTDSRNPDPGALFIPLVGELARHIYDAAKDAMVPQVYWCETKEEAKPILAELVKPNSTILVKASRGMAFEELVDDLKRITKEP